MKRTPMRRTRMAARRRRLSGMSPKRRSLEHEYAEFVLGIKDRDGWRCVYCRSRSGALDPHHVQKRSQAPERLMDATNVVTLCRACHEWTDAPYSASEGRLVVEALGEGRFMFSVVHAANKFQARLAGAIP